MTEEELRHLLNDLRQMPRETEWVEFKVNYYEPQEIGEYISALSNSACLHDQRKGYLVFGIENVTHNIVGTKFKPKQKKIGNQELENWLATQLNPKIDFVIHEFQADGKSVVLFKIDAADKTPVVFRNIGHIRVGSYKKKLLDHPEKERKIWNKVEHYDWSATICEKASISDLNGDAIQKARKEFKEKHHKLANDVDTWDDIKFLNKAKVTINDEITNTAILLLGKTESEHFISPSVARISWILKDEQNIEKDYEHFSPPFILNVEKVFAKVRNLKYRYLPGGTLFPIEITQYDSWVIREALHNCIAHQDYELKGKINIVERPDELIFTNVGHFIPGNIETVIKQDSPPAIYRNHFLTQAMVNLNMIDTIGSGIKRMFQKQRERFFPLPDYDLSHSSRVIVKIPGKVLDENYTRLLIEKTDLDLSTVMVLDKVQKRISISKSEHKFLKLKRLIEGRYPNLFVSYKIADVTGDRSTYIKNLAFDNDHYKKMILAFLEKYKRASRKDIDNLLINKLSDALDEKQKQNKVKNLLHAMSKKDRTIINKSSCKNPTWVINK